MPDAVVAYVDCDPVAVAHSEALLAKGSSQVVAAGGDMRDPEAVLAGQEISGAGFDLAVPACVILCCVLHFLDAETAKDVVARFARARAPGSYLIISVGFGKGRAGEEFASSYNAQDGSRIYSHTWEQIAAMFRGLELVPPGITDSATWRAVPPQKVRPEQDSMILAGVGRRP
jgi:O-methyltransferase involved in polyketide biosynthesis